MLVQLGGPPFAEQTPAPGVPLSGVSTGEPGLAGHRTGHANTAESVSLSGGSRWPSGTSAANAAHPVHCLWGPPGWRWGVGI